MVDKERNEKSIREESGAGEEPDPQKLAFIPLVGIVVLKTRAR
jgi:hypothetical protein